MPRLRSIALLLLVVPVARAEDWPQWLGPRRDGTSAEKVVPWKGPLKVVWRQPVGEAHSSPVVAGGKVYLHTKVKDKEAEQVAAYDAATGKPLWQAQYDRAKFASPFGAGPQATPAVSDGRVYPFGATGVLSCLDAAKGKELWRVDTLKEYAATNLFFGASCSPLVEGDKVLVNVGGKGASVVAFKKDTGAVAWKRLDDRASYSSPIAFGTGKERQVVFLTQRGLASFAPADGTVFWKFPLVDKLNESSTTPVKVGDLLLASSVTFGSVGLRLEDKGGKPSASQVWKNTDLTCYFATPIPVGLDHVYMVTGALALVPEATLRCVDAKTGKELWKKPGVGKYHAALLRTGDGKFLLLKDDGELALFDPDPKGYRERSRSKVCGPTWAHPALSDGRLYLRDEKELLCVEVPGGQ
jgi:outer membrane protein assembly factor BamB